MKSATDIQGTCILRANEFSKGIAQAITQAGLKAILIEVNEDIAQKLESTDLVMKAFPEDVALKKKVFHDIDRLCSPRIIFATTSYRSITEIASATRADRFVGLNFLHPAPQTKLAQIVNGLKTSNETYDTCRRFVEKIGKVAVKVSDSPGFILNQALVSMINEAIFVLMYGIASRDDIDNMIKVGANSPMGSLELADSLGLDTALHSLELLYKELGAQYRPCPLLRKMVAAGYLGKKTRKGFHGYG